MRHVGFPPVLACDVSFAALAGRDAGLETGGPQPAHHASLTLASPDTVLAPRNRAHER